MAVLPGISLLYEELAGSPTFTYDRRGGKGKQVFKVAWQDIVGFLLQVFPDPYILAGQVIIPPATYFPGQPWLLAQSVDMKPLFNETIIGDGTFPAAYTHAEMTINYATERFNQSASDPYKDGPGGSQQPQDPQGNPVTFLTQKITVGGEFLTWPNSALNWESPSDPAYNPALYPDGPPPNLFKVGEDTHVGITVPIIEHNWNWQHVAFPPWLYIRQLIGKVNAYAFAGAPAQTLLFSGCEASREVTTDGVRAWTLDYKFSEKNNNAINPSAAYGWNHFLRPAGKQVGTWDRVLKRVPGGFTRLSAPVNVGDGQLTVVDAADFPQTPPFKISVGGDARNVIVLNPGGAKNTFVVDFIFNMQHAGPSSANTPDGTPVVQIRGSTLSGGVDDKQTTISIPDAAFVVNGAQFYVTVEQETMAVTKVVKQGAGQTLTVLRGISGTTAAAHGGNALVKQAAQPLYDLGDFKYLFASGLQGG